jgi:hypothetical protein
VKEPILSRGPQPGQRAYDAATGSMGVLQAIHDVSELAFEHRMPGQRVAFLGRRRAGRSG